MCKEMSPSLEAVELRLISTSIKISSDSRKPPEIVKFPRGKNIFIGVTGIFY